MSLENKNFWNPTKTGCLTSGGMGYDESARGGPKRTHPLLFHDSEEELYCNKKQAIESVNGRSGNSTANISLLENNSNLQPVSSQFPDHLVGSSQPFRTSSLTGRNIPPTFAGDVNMTNKGFDCQVGYGSAGGQSYDGDNNKISMSGTSNKSGNNAFNNVMESIISLGSIPNFNKIDNNSISTGHSYNKQDGTFMLMGNNYSKVDSVMSSMLRSLDKGDGNFLLRNQQSEKRDGDVMKTTTIPVYNNNNFMTLSSLCKANENFTPLGNTSVLPINAAAYLKGDSSMLSIGQNHNNGGKKYDMFMNQPSAAQISRDYVQPIANPLLSGPSSFGLKPDTVPKNKEKKTRKVSNNFPSNVKSLLITGMFDGVPVKYVSWSREKSLRGIIKGSGYLCDCKECRLAVALNAYEFERHAGCKTKHPNNHIYFQNGKTVYGVVQELKNTPQDKLADAIQTVTGSIINMRNFCKWRGSDQAAGAATIEFQRIYGQDEPVKIIV